MKWANWGFFTWKISIFFEKWMGHRFLPEKTVPSKERPGRTIFVLAPFLFLMGYRFGWGANSLVACFAAYVSFVVG